MASDDPIRASDSDREVVVTTLREAYTAGRLDLDEFDERMTAAYQSKTWGDLRILTADLPAQPILGGDVPGRLFGSAVQPGEPPARLPAHPPRENMPPTQRRRHPVAILLPVAVWILLATHAGNGSGSATAFLIFSVVALAVIVSAIRRR